MFPALCIEKTVFRLNDLIAPTPTVIKISKLLDAVPLTEGHIALIPLCTFDWLKSAILITCATPATTTITTTPATFYLNISQPIVLGGEFVSQDQSTG